MKFPILSMIVLSPFLGAILITFLGKKRPKLVRLVATITTSISLLLSLYLLFIFDKSIPGYQFLEKINMVESLGLSYTVGIDGMSLALVLLTAIIIFSGVFASWTIKERDHEFYALLLVLVTGVFGVFVSLDLLFFFLFYELSVLPLFFLIGIWGSSKKIPPKGPMAKMIIDLGLGRKEYAAMKLTFYLLFGSAFILVGILALYFKAPHPTFSIIELEKFSFPLGFQKLVFSFFYFGFGILAGIWPFHTWSPDGHASAPTAVSMLHAGVLMKLGAYGVVRLGLGLSSDGASELAIIVGTIAIINIVYGAFSAMAQTDLKYVIAYSSVSHMGIVMLGAATLTEVGMNGAIFQMFAHGIMTGLFFAIVGLVYEKSHTREIREMGGFGKKMPGVATAFVIGGVFFLGLPGLSGFVAEILTFLGAWKSSFQWWLFPAGLGAFLTAVYVLRVAKLIFFGQVGEGRYSHLSDAQGPEWVSLILLSAILIIFGFLPFVLLYPIDITSVGLIHKIMGPGP